MPRSPDPWRCAECGEGGRKRAPGAEAHAVCLATAAFREDVLQLVERFPRAPLAWVATRLGGGITVADVERFITLARARRDRQREAAEGHSPPERRR